MNLRVVSRLLGIVAMLIGGMMVFSLPWAHPALGHRNDDHIVPSIFVLPRIVVGENRNQQNQQQLAIFFRGWVHIRNQALLFLIRKDKHVRI